MVISLAKHINKRTDPLVEPLVDACRDILGSVAHCTTEVSPGVGESCQQSLLALSAKLSGEITPPMVRETASQIQTELEQWSGRVVGYSRQKTTEFKEIIALLTFAAHSTLEKDEHYSTRFDNFRCRLEEMGNLDDLPAIREALVSSAAELKDCIERMRQDTHEQTRHLRQQVSVYQAKLEEAERFAFLDPLTQLENRRGLERNLELRVAGDKQFCVIVADLNGFKEINDKHGHIAGDDLLRQFGVELKGIFRKSDVIGRWGGDEFIVLMEGTLDEARIFIERIKQWVLGEYRISAGSGTKAVVVGASIGVAAWNGSEAGTELLARADRAMYANKAQRR